MTNTIDLDELSAASYKERGTNPCLLCGKNVKTVRYQVHLTTEGYLVATDEDLANSQGLFPIGSEFSKKLPEEFVF